MKKILIVLLILLVAYCFYSQNSVKKQLNNATADFTPLPIVEHTEEEKTVKTENKRLLGVYTIYAYCPCEKCCGKRTGITASGTIATEGRTVAATFPFGTKLLIDGKEYVVEDRGGGIGNGKIDLFMNSHEKALQHGVKRLEVWELIE